MTTFTFIREEILKYWHVIEFLNQNEFPTIKIKNLFMFQR